MSPDLICRLQEAAPAPAAEAEPAKEDAAEPAAEAAPTEEAKPVSRHPFKTVCDDSSINWL